ncbi:MAG: hypothetical protein LBC87_04610 [Fibromonadaceae bacterium]|jgi:hypothetical protein|nr:hypothetical protein [Fibromonadaceae bacterium]
MKTNRFLSLVAIFAVSFAFFACSNDDSSLEPSSDSSQKVYCQLTSGACSQMSLSACMELVSAGQAIIAQNCSAGNGSSSSVDNGRSSSSEEQPQPSTSWDITGTVELGGASNATLGSFLDVDTNPFTVYMAGQAAANKNKIDLVFDGTYFLTQEGCVEVNNSLCGARMAGYDENFEATLLDVSNVSAIKATSTPDEIWDYIEANINTLIDKRVLQVIAKKGGKFLMETTDGDLALIIVNDVSTSSAKLSISRVAWE